MSDESPQTPHNAPPAADPQSIEGLFLQALGQSPEQRQAFLDEACGADAERRLRIEALLRAYEDAGSFLEKPPAGVDAAATVSLEFLAPSSDPGLLGTLGHYEVYEMLGRGGMGIVFRARDPKLNRVVAIKVLAPELAANPNARRRFLREAKTAAAISHPHVVTIHAVDEGSAADGGNPASSGSRVSALPFIVMECIVGQTLQQKLDKHGSLRLTEILRIGHQTAQGLAAAHRQGLIHRDIKPANILLENGVERVKITDFGLARAADDVSITRTGEVSGTPQYMSPEQASGGTIDHRSDLFSLGCVLYAMCTGRSPFRATTLAAAIRRVCDDTPRPIEEINPEAPHWLIDIVNRLLAKDPDERIQSADEVAELLGDHLARIQHPHRVRAAEPARARAVEAAPRPASAATGERGLGMQVPLRLLLWLGAIALLFPVFFALIGTAIGAGGDALEGAARAAVICWPIAILLFAVALLDRSLQGNPFANAMFLLVCILLGPIGILLYLVRRDQYFMGASQPAGEPPAREQPQHGAAARSESANVPQWLLTPLPDPVKLLALLLGIVAALLMGQAIEQWSDVDQAAGTFLFINAAVLGLLGAWIAVAAGVRFDAAKSLLLAVVATGLMYLGAQAPDREFKQGLERFVQSSDAIAWITGGVVLISAWIAYCVYAAIYSTNDDRSPGERLGRGLVACGIVLWALLAAWMVSVAAQIIPPPPFAHRDLVGGLVMSAVVIGGVLFVLGMILSRWVVTPGMVRQFSDATQPRSSERGAAATPVPSSTGVSPWRVLGWMIIAGLVVVPSCLIVGLGVPYLAQARSEIGVVQVNFDSARTISWVVARGDIGAAHAEQRTFEQAVTTNPFRLPLPVGVYDLTMTYQADGTTGQFVQRVQVEPGKTKILDVSQKIAAAHQLQHLGRPPKEDDGYPAPRTIPLGETGEGISGGAGSMPSDAFGGSSAAVAEGAVLLTITDPGLSVVFDPAEDDAAEGGAAAMGTLGMEYGAEMGGYSGMMGGGMGPGMGGWMGATSSGTVKLPEGTYRVLVTDQLAGWGRATHSPGFGMGMAGGSPGPQLPSSELPERLQVVAGEFRKLTVSRDLKRVAALQPDWQQRGFFAFRWNGETYDLTRTQAVVVQRLLEAGFSDAPEALLLAPAEMSAETRKLEPVTLSLEEARQRLAESEHPTLKLLFNDGQHPAWGTMIVPGEQAESYRLAELRSGDISMDDTPQVMVDVTITDPGLRVALEQLTTDPQRTIPRGNVLDQSGTISLTPATYQVIVEDELAGWMTRTDDGEPGPVRYLDSMLDVQPHRSAEVNVASISRNFHKMAAAFPRGINRGTHFFRWQGETYELKGEQAPVVAFLLKAYADGEPDLHEARLLRGGTFRGDQIDLPPLTSTQAEELLATLREEGHSLKALFDDGEHPAWGTMIVPGELADSYRLAELRSPEAQWLPAASQPAMTALQIDIKDPGLHLYLHTGTPEHLRWIGPIDTPQELAVEAGTYTSTVEDDLAGWRTTTKYGEPDVVRYEFDQVSLTPDETQKLTVDRNFYKMGATYQQGAQLSHFLWNGQTYELNHNQSLAVARLLHALADGSINVHEGRLLRQPGVGDKPNVMPPMSDDTAEGYRVQDAENGNTLKNWFQSGQHPAWGTLVIEGEKPHTWRLPELLVEVEQSEANTEGDAQSELPVDKTEDQ